MTIPLPQTKTFVFPKNAETQKIDSEINEWKKSITIKGDQVCPSPPSITTGSGCVFYVYTYSKPLDVPDPEPKKKK